MLTCFIYPSSLSHRIGFLTVFVFGTIFYNGDAYAGISLIALPEGLYIQDYSVLGAFLAAPLGSLGFTFVAFGIRGLVTLGWSKFKGEDYTVFERKEWDTNEFALDEDRPGHLFSSGQDGKEDSEIDGKSEEELDGGFLHGNGTGFGGLVASLGKFGRKNKKEEQRNELKPQSSNEEEGS